MTTTRCFAIFGVPLLMSLAGSGAPALSTSNNSLPLGQSHSVRMGTNKVHYVTAGKGSQTLVFVHCWAGNSGFWREQVPALADQARLILIDLPGHWLMLEKPAEFNAALRATLGKFGLVGK